MTNRNPAALYGVEVGIALKAGGDYEVEQYATKTACRRRVRELRAEGYKPGLRAKPGERYADAQHLDSTGCPTALLR